MKFGVYNAILHDLSSACSARRVCARRAPHNAHS
jgi:hypothetical protein